MASDKVQKVLDKLMQNPEHLKALELVLTMMCKKANVQLNDAEKEELLKELASRAEVKGVTG